MKHEKVCAGKQAALRRVACASAVPGCHIKLTSKLNGRESPFNFVSWWTWNCERHHNQSSELFIVIEAGNDSTDIVYSRCLIPRLVGYTVFDDSTMFPTLWCRCIGYEFQSVFFSNWQSWSTEYCTATLQKTSDRSLGCLTFRVDHHCDLHHPNLFSSRQFVARLLVQGRLWYPGQLYGTVCRLTLRLSTVCQSFVVS